MYPIPDVMNVDATNHAEDILVQREHNVTLNWFEMKPISLLPASNRHVDKVITICILLN